MNFEDLFFRINNFQKGLIVAAICILLFGLFFVTFISDMSSSPIWNEISNITKENDIQKVKLRREPVLRANIENHRDHLRELVLSLPEKQDFEGLSKQIDRLLTETSLETVRFAPAKEIVDDEVYFAETPFQLNIKGDYKKVGTFMGKVYDLPRVVDITKITLRPREKEQSPISQTVLLEADILGKTFRRLSQNEIESLEQAKKSVQSGARR